MSRRFQDECHPEGGSPTEGSGLSSGTPSGAMFGMNPDSSSRVTPLGMTPSPSERSPSLEQQHAEIAGIQAIVARVSGRIRQGALARDCPGGAGGRGRSRSVRPRGWRPRRSSARHRPRRRRTTWGSTRCRPSRHRWSSRGGRRRAKVGRIVAIDIEVNSHTVLSAEIGVVGSRSIVVGVRQFGNFVAADCEVEILLVVSRT